MDALDIVRVETKFAYEWLENIVQDVSSEQAAWHPPGTANSIAATYAHIMLNADVDLTRFFHGRDPLLAGAWGARLGRDESEPVVWEPDAEFDWELLRQYGREVQEHVARLVAALTTDGLERTFQMVPLWLGEWKGIDIYTLHGWRHLEMHGGEIACLKGLRGMEGYPPRPVVRLHPQATKLRVAWQFARGDSSRAAMSTAAGCPAVQRRIVVSARRRWR